MNRPLFLFPICLMIASLVTGLWYSADAWRQDRLDQDYALKLARQVSAQAEGLLLTARTEGKPQALDWTVGQLTQGPADRQVRLSKVTGSYHDGGEKTALTQDLKTNSKVFEYTKIFSPTDQQGVKIEVLIPFRGLMGTQTPVTRDAATFLLFAWVFWATHLWVTRKTVRVVADPNLEKEPKEPNEEEPKSEPLLGSVQDWTARYRFLITEAGMGLRDTFRDAKILAVAASRSHKNISGLRSQIHETLEKMRNTQSRFKHSEGDIKKAIELHTGMSRALSTPQMKELGHLLDRIEREQKQSREVMLELEKMLEPWATDADLAFHSFDQIETAVKSLDELFPKTKEVLIEQAKLVQGMQEKVKKAA